MSEKPEIDIDYIAKLARLDLGAEGSEAALTAYLAAFEGVSPSFRAF